MKKLVFWGFIALLTSSCGGREGNTDDSKNKADSGKALAMQQPASGFTLNGLNKNISDEQINYFDCHKDEDDNPDIVSVWLDSAIVHQMYDLVCNEHGDGIRLYFGAEKGRLPFLKTSIIFVSTKNDPTNTAGKSDHRDYYNHDSNDPLFQKLINSLQTLKPILRNDNCDTAALLYNRSGLTNIPCPGDDPRRHNITRSDAEAMVVDFRDKKHEINTASEWFDLEMFEPYTKNHYYDGLRIYYSTRQPGQDLPGRDCFVITTTVLSADHKKHIDDFSCNTKNPFFYGYNSAKSHKFIDPKDNGQLCPFNCN